MTTATAPHPAASMLRIIRRHPVSTCFVAAYLFSWSYWIPLALSGSVLLVALWHASFNLVTGTRAGRGTLAAMVSIAVMIFGYGLAAADSRARRKGAPAVLG